MSISLNGIFAEALLPERSTYIRSTGKKESHGQSGRKPHSLPVADCLFGTFPLAVVCIDPAFPIGRKRLAASADLMYGFTQNLVV